ncbi:MAG: integrase core domain-containing protein [bacterium]|nr:integrase core domain-containing protein [bacterium]
MTKTANKVGISRAWLSHVKSVFEKGGKDPRTLEPESKAPSDTSKRKRISKDIEKKILKVRKDSRNVWGKVKISVALERDYGMKVSPNTVNSYLNKHGKIDPKISLKNTRAWQAKKARETMEVELRVKYRPPKEIKDYAPGALVEKDMKYIPKYAQTAPGKSGENFFNQHTEICSFTRVRALELEKDGTAKGSAEAHMRSTKRFPFNVACENTDNGSENNKEMRATLQKENVFHFYSNIGTPTDNPRVERSHLTDEVEFYQKGGLKKSFEEQKEALAEWETFYNFKRPHQALGYLTPMEFYELWKKDPSEAIAITKKYQSYLLKQRIRLASARKIKKKEQVEALMKFIDAKLENKKSKISVAKLQLINCQLCSMA